MKMDEQSMNITHKRLETIAVFKDLKSVFIKKVGDNISI